MGSLLSSDNQLNINAKNPSNKDSEKSKETSKYGEFDQLYAKFDENGNNSLSEIEIISCFIHFKNIHPEHSKKVDELVAEITVNEDNPISLEDFRRIMNFSFNNTSVEENLLEVFKIHDTQLSYELGPIDIMSTFKKLGLNIELEDVKNMIREGNLTGGSETLNFEDFVKILVAK